VAGGLLAVLGTLIEPGRWPEAARAADFAAETAQLTRSQILVNANMSVLAVANQTPQAVLSLLG